MKAKLINHEKTTDELGNTIEVKIWRIAKTQDKPHGYKYSLSYIIDDKRVIGYDNAEGKGDHRHYKGHEEGYKFSTIWELIKDFYRDIEKYKKGEKNYES